MQKTLEQEYIDVSQQFALRKLSDAFFNIVSEKMNDFEQIVILCIGTDRSTGDSFGPLIGHKLSSMAYENVFVYGNLDNPVHAKNLEENIARIYKKHSKPMVIAIDACLGRIEHIGYISVGDGPVKPGTGVNKDLPSIGDISITGIVNVSGFMEFVVLQNTRLSLVMRMADLTAHSIRFGLWKYLLNKNPQIPALVQN